MNVKIKELCDRYADNYNFSGVCLVKSGEETIFSGAYGYANLSFNNLNTMETKFDVASITKVFTAAAVLLLVQQGKLSLNDRITDIIDLQNTQIPSDVEIHHLLSHTSGIADDADEESGEEYSSLFIDQPNYAFRKCSDFLKNFLHKKPNFKAGTNVRYNNVAFILLGLAIEKISGLDCREFMVQNVFKPCNMLNTKFLAMDDINTNTAEGYYPHLDNDGNFICWKKNIYRYPPIGTPDGGIYTTANDLHTFITSIIQNKILNKSYSNLLFTPQCEFLRPIASNVQTRFGYAFEFIEIDGDIFRIYKDGCNDGVASMLSYYPKRDVRIIILANQNCNVWEMHSEMEKQFLI